MRNRFYLALAVLASLVGCQKELEAPEVDSTIMDTESFYGVIEQNDTKTYIDDLRNIRWQKGDQVAAFLQSTAGKKYQIEDAADGKTSGQFNLIKGSTLTGGTETGLTAAYYPYSPSLELVASGMNSYCLDGIVLPAVQEYDPVNTVSQNVLPMLAAGNDADNVLNFRNICGVFQFSLKGDAVLSHLIFRGNDGETVCGKAQIDVVPNGLPAIKMMKSDTQKNLFLVFGKDGLKLDPSKETIFRVAVPPMIFHKGFEVLVYDRSGKGMSLKKTESAQIKRSTILNFPSVKYVPGEIEASPEIPSPVVPPTPENKQGNNEIYYTSIDGRTLAYFNKEMSRNRYGAYFLSDKYEKGRGVLTFDGDVKYIGENAFFRDDLGPSNLRTISLPLSAVSIEASSFSYCVNLHHLYVHENIRIIDGSAFSSCGFLEIEVSPDNAYYSSLDGVLYNKDASVLIAYTKDLLQPMYQVPEGVSEVGENAFGGCIVQSLTLPKSLVKINAKGLDASSFLESLFFQSDCPPVLAEEASLPFYAEDKFWIRDDFRMYVPSQSVEKYKSAEYFNQFTDHIYGFDYDSGKTVLKFTTESFTSTPSGGLFETDYVLADPFYKGKLSVSSDQEWIKDLSLKEHKLSFSVGDNKSGLARDGVITVTYPDINPVIIPVHQDAGVDMVVTANGIDIPLIKVDGGTFTMGATAEQGNTANEDSKPVHEVTISDYYIGQTEVTQELWEAVMGTNPSYYQGNPKNPVEQVSWNEIVNGFLPKLNALTGKAFNLPTEAEWEFAARGGNKSKGHKYSGSDNPDDVAWFSKNNKNYRAEVVGQRSPNELGIYDMSGNVMEYCSDWYGNYNAEAQIDPIGPSSGSEHVVRGGCFFTDAKFCRVTSRTYYTPIAPGMPDMDFMYGFRLALSL